jgi:hypothetical protein
MANLITFRYLNDDTLVAIEGLEVDYTVKVIAVLSNNKGETTPRGAVYTSDVISLTPSFLTTDSSGEIEVDVTDIFTDSTFLEIYNKFSNIKGYNVSIEIQLTTRKQEIGPYVYISTTNIPRELSAYNVTIKEGVYEYPNLDYFDVYNDFTVKNIVINQELLESFQAQKLSTQRDFNNKLQSFQNEINSQSILQIPVFDEFNPINITQIITRCLELEVGTIENGLYYTTDAGLSIQTTRLQGIKNRIEQISNLYPTITIEDGEGLPYQTIGQIPSIFRGFGFFRQSGDIIGTIYLVDKQRYKDCDNDIRNGKGNIILNGEGIFEFNFEDGFNVNLSEILEEKSITLVSGDIIELSVSVECKTYTTKLIIKN